MNGLPYYKAYPRDFVEGTAGMRFELKGAYRLVIDLIYMQGGKLPDDPRYISGLLGCSVKKWNGLRNELLGLGKISAIDNSLTNFRAITELEILTKYQDKQSENASKPRKNKNLQQPNVSHTEPEPDTYKKEQQLGARMHVYDELIEAASSRGRCHQNMAMGITPITDLIEKGYSLESDILPVIREKASPSIRSWSYFVAVIIQRQADKQAVPSKPKPKQVNWSERVSAFYDDGIWAMGWGPRPGDPGCGAPSELIRIQ